MGSILRFYSLETHHNMELCRNKQFILFLIPILCNSLFNSRAEAEGKQRSLKNNNKVSAVYVFGDSTVDPGNNNYVKTIFRSDFQPYGKDFPNKQPTGRFTNGRLTTDFIASYVGVKEYVPPYLDPNLTMEELMTGVSFASAGSGFDPLTPTISNVIGLPKQLEYFKEYKKKIESAIGKERMEDHINRALFILSAGTNDFVVNYFSLPIRRKTYTVPAYQQFVFQKESQFLQDLWEEGARKMIVAGIPAMGCLPIVITLNSQNAFQQRGCIENYNSVARDYNVMLQNHLNFMQFRLANRGARIYYLDIHKKLEDIIRDHQKLGFEEVNYGCCGTGYLEASFLCNPGSYVCDDASKYVFFDSIHPSEMTCYNIFKSYTYMIDRITKD